MAPTEPAPGSGRPAEARTVIAVALIGAAAVLVAAVAIPTLLSLAAGGTSPGPGSFGAADLGQVQVYDSLPADHRDGRIDYPQAPPPGGPHNARWLECGIYTEAVPDELAVHSLEHGTVWITYRPGLSADDLQVLQEMLPSDGIMSPYPGQESPVVVTVWGRQLALRGATDPRLRLFIDHYGDGHTSLEPQVTCHGGLSLEEARRAAGRTSV